MASGHRNGQVDFDDLFDPDIIGDGPVANGYAAKHVGLRYAHVRYGTRRADVGYRIGGQDVASLWAAKGTATYTLPFHGKGFTSGNQAKSNSGGTCSANVRLNLMPDGTYTITKASTGGGNDSSSTVDSGRWLPTGQSAAEYEIYITADSIGRASFSTSATGFVSMASAQSATISISVQSASSDYAQAAVDIHCHVRRSGLVQVSSINAHVSATGWY